MGNRTVKGEDTTLTSHKNSPSASTIMAEAITKYKGAACTTGYYTHPQAMHEAFS